MTEKIADLVKIFRNQADVAANLTKLTINLTKTLQISEKPQKNLTDVILTLWRSDNNLTIMITDLAKATINLANWKKDDVFSNSAVIQELIILTK